MLPSMADVVKAVNVGHVVDIESAEGTVALTVEQSEAIKASITTALFSEVDISKIHFEDPTFDGSKLRLICNNDATKDWLLAIIPKLTLWEGALVEARVIGPPPKLIRASIVMPAPTYEPSTLFSIIGAQNGICTKFWKYLSRTKVINGKQTWYISVDENALEPLKAISFKPFVGIGRIKISTTNNFRDNNSK